MIILGIGNKWGLPPDIPLHGWIEIEGDKRLYWTRDFVAEWESKVQWHKLNPGKYPQTEEDMIWVSPKYKSKEI